MRSGLSESNLWGVISADLGPDGVWVDARGDVKVGAGAGVSVGVPPEGVPMHSHNHNPMCHSATISQRWRVEMGSEKWMT